MELPTCWAVASATLNCEENKGKESAPSVGGARRACGPHTAEQAFGSGLKTHLLASVHQDDRAARQREARGNRCIREADGAQHGEKHDQLAEIGASGALVMAGSAGHEGRAS